MPSLSVRPAVLVGLALVVLATAYCGGKVGGPQATGPDASSGGCPSSEEIYSIGTPCAWSAVCTLQIDVCENGQGVTTSAVCSAGGIEVAPGQGFSCSVGVGPSTCPDPSNLGGVCNDGMVCPGSSPECGTVDCTCEDGLWACPGCSPGTGVGSDAGDDDGGEGDDSGSSDDSGSAPDAETSMCFASPGPLHAETVAGVFCPFSAVNGGADVVCAAGQSCCVTPEGAGASTCMSAAMCPVAGSVRIECEGAPDCAASSEVCCGYGSIETQPAQPGCGPGGSTLPPSSYVAGFNYGPSGIKGSGGTFCAATCAVSNDAGTVPTFQVCSQNSDCAVHQVCTAIKPAGVGLGYCGVAVDAGTGG